MRDTARLIFTILCLATFLITGCEPSASGGRAGTGSASQAELEDRQPSELLISIAGPDGRLELLLTEPRLIVRLCLQPLASAKEGREHASHNTLGALKLKYSDGTSEVIDLLVPFGHVRRGGRVLAADLEAMKKYMEVAAKSAFGFMADARPSNTKAVLRGHKDRVFALAFSPDGQHLASAGDDSDILIWDASAGNVRLPSRRTGTDSLRYFLPGRSSAGRGS